MTGFRLPTKNAPAPAAEEAPPTRPVIKGWPSKGSSAATSPAPAPAAETTQREAIRARVTPQRQPEPVTTEATEDDLNTPPSGRGMFSKGVQAALDPAAEFAQTEQAKSLEQHAAEDAPPKTDRPKVSTRRKTDTPAEGPHTVVVPYAGAAPYPTSPFYADQNLNITISGSAESVMRIIRAMALA